MVVKKKKPTKASKRCWHCKYDEIPNCPGFLLYPKGTVVRQTYVSRLEPDRLSQHQ